MVNVIVVLIMIVAVAFAIRGTIVHLRGKGSCCGGGGGETLALEKSLDGKIVFRKNVKIQGMVCENCSAHVQNALNEINGLSAKVNLRKSVAKVEAIREVSEEEIRNAVLKAGNYSVEKIEDR